MQATDVFEAFNHFLSTRDASQLLSFADEIEVFCSSTFGNGRTYFGQIAPGHFRDTIGVMRAIKKEVTVEVIHVTPGIGSTTFFIIVTRGRKKTSSALNVVISNGKLKSFVETPTKF